MAKKKGVRLLSEMPPSLIASIRQWGVYRCGVLVPNCPNEPVGELNDGTKLRRLFCRKHLAYFCRKHGVPEPVYPSDMN